MKNTKLIVLAAALAAFGLAGCGQTAATSSAAQGDESKGTETQSAQPAESAEPVSGLVEVTKEAFDAEVAKLSTENPYNKAVGVAKITSIVPDMTGASEEGPKEETIIEEATKDEDGKWIYVEGEGSEAKVYDITDQIEMYHISVLADDPLGQTSPEVAEAAFELDTEIKYYQGSEGFKIAINGSNANAVATDSEEAIDSEETSEEVPSSAAKTITIVANYLFGADGWLTHADIDMFMSATIEIPGMDPMVFESTVKTVIDMTWSK